MLLYKPILGLYTKKDVEFDCWHKLDDRDSRKTIF